MILPIDIRFIDLNSSNKGGVEIYYQKQWRVLNAHNWDESKGNLTCKALGFSYAKEVFFIDSKESPGVEWTSAEHKAACPNEQTPPNNWKYGDFLVLSPNSQRKAGVKCISEGKIYLISNTIRLGQSNIKE